MPENREVACTCTSESPATQLIAAIDTLSADHLDSLPLPQLPRTYSRVTLCEDDQMEVAAARWISGGQSILHGHGESAAVYRVMSGTIEEQRYVPEGDGYRFEVVVLKAGDETYLPPGSFHMVRALEPAVTVHAYSPPPVNATSEIPGDTQQLLEAARRRAARKQKPAKTVPFVAPRPRQSDPVTTVRELLDGWAQREAQANREGQLSMPAGTLAEMRSCGILAAPMPVHLGGWNSSLLEVTTAVRLIARRAPATALALVMPLGNAATTRIPEAAIPSQHRQALIKGQRWIAHQICRGRILAVANSEPGAGGDLASTKTTAKLGEYGVYHLNGRKSFATFGRDADYFLCAARTSDTLPEERRSVVDGFFVAREAPGLTIDNRWNPVGMRPTASVGLTLENAPAEALLGFPGCLEGVNARHWSTALFAAVFLGVGEGALHEGSQQGSTAGTWARSTLAECALNLEAAAGFIEAVARDERWPLPADAQERTRRAKTFVARAAVETATRAAMVCGGRCYTPDHPIFRFLCDALAGPLLRPPLPRAMDAIIADLFPAERKASA